MKKRAKFLVEIVIIDGIPYIVLPEGSFELVEEEIENTNQCKPKKDFTDYQSKHERDFFKAVLKELKEKKLDEKKQ